MNIHEIKKKITEYKSGLWTKEKIIFLDIALDTIDSDKPFTYKELPQLYKKFNLELASPNRNERSKIRFVLNAMNECAGYQIDLPTEKIKVPRPSILPANNEDYKSIRDVQEIISKLNKIKIASCNQGCPFLVLIATKFITMNMTSGPILIWLLANLRWNNLDFNKKKIEIFFDIKSESKYVLPVSDSIIILLNKIKRLAKPTNTHDYIFLPNTQGSMENVEFQTLSLKQQNTKIKSEHKKDRKRRNELKKELNDQFKSFTDKIVQEKLLWNTFSSLALMLPVLNHGIEPFIGTVASTFPLPTPNKTSKTLPFLYSDLSESSYLTCPKQISKFDEKSFVKSEENKNIANIVFSVDNFLTESKRIIRILIRKLKNITDRNINTDIRINKASAIIEELLIEANKIAPEYSALHLGLKWIKSEIKLKKPTANTISTKTSLTLTSRLLKIPEAINLSNWADEEHESLISIYIEEQNNQYTKDNIISAFQSLYKFSNANGFTDNVNIKFFNQEFRGGSNRANIISPPEFKKYYDCLTKTNSRENKLISIASILSYWGGLRHAEVIMLTLDNIVHGDGELYIEILKGKTEAARRRIPLHLLAPRYAIDAIVSLYLSRRNEFSKAASLKNIYLFGPEKNKERYNSYILINPTIETLRIFFKIDTLVFHGLRHCFLNILIIRWYALFHPEIIKDLSFRDNEIFTPSSQKKINSLFSLPRIDFINPTKATDLITISKLLGHKGQKTLFSSYIHSFHTILAYAIRFLDGELEDIDPYYY